MIIVCKRKHGEGLLGSIFDVDYTFGAIIETDLTDFKSVLRKGAQLEGAGFEILVVPVGTTPELYREFRRKHPDVPITKNYWPRMSSIPAGDFKELGGMVGSLLSETAYFFRGTDDGLERLVEDEF